MRMHQVLSPTLLSAVICAIVQSPAYASSGSGKSMALEEIVVTAQRREQGMQDVPISVNAISADNLNSKGIDTITSLSAVVPGLDVPMVGSVASPYLRGIGSNAADPNNEPSVAMYVDGVYMAAPFSNMFSFNNIERVEVLKGPQGTLFGRNATGGVIQIITSEPQFEPMLEASLGYANYATSSVDLYGSTGISATAAMDLAIQYEEQGDGWGTNNILGTDTYKTRQHSARSKLLLTPSDKTKIIVSGDYSERTSSAGDYQLAPGVAGLDGNTHFSDRYDTDTNRPYNVEAEAYGGSVKLEQELDIATLISITSYRKNDGVYDFDADATPIDYVTAILNQEVETATQEFQLVGGDENLDWLLGAFYFDNSATYNPGELSGLAIGPGVDLYGIQDTESWSVYGQSSAGLTDKLRGTLGLRYTSEEQEFSSKVNTTPIPGSANDFEKLTWRLALDYTLTDDAMAYVSYNRGIKSGGFDILSPGNQGYAPEILDAYEIGVKSQLLDNRLRLNTAAFYYDYQDMQVTSIQQNTTSTANAASASIKGVEFDLEAVLTESLTLTSGVAWMDGQYDDFPNPVVNPASPTQAPVTLANAGGNKTIRTPELTGYVGLDHVLTTTIGTITTSVNVSYNDGYFWAPDERYAQDGYTLVSGTLGWRSQDDTLGISLWGKNLTDEEYLLQGVPSAYGDLAVYAAPRTFGVTVSTTF